MFKIKELVDILFDAYGEKAENQRAAYRFVLQNTDLEFLNDRIAFMIKTWKPVYGQKVPPVAEILEPLTKVVDQEAVEAEVKFTEFMTLANNNLRGEQMPDWVYTIKIMMGAGYIENCKEDDVPWIKKEFLRIWSTIKDAGLEIRRSPGLMPIVQRTRRLTEGEEQKLQELLTAGMPVDKVKEIAKTMMLSEPK